MDTLRDGIDAYNQTYLEINGEEDELYTEGPRRRRISSSWPPSPARCRRSCKATAPSAH